jgi:phage tail sheath protein FI
MRELVLVRNSYPAALPPLTTDVGNFGGAYQLGIAANPDIYGSPAPTVITLAVQNIRARMNALYANVVNLISAFSNDVQNLADGLEQSLVSSSPIYANIKTAIKREGIIVPPSGAMAGVYAAVDGTRGVWKAPANVALNTVIEPMVNIDNNTQDDLNIDVNAGKSINAIRSFSGKGTLVWGARTLAGNDNEWRYVSVRRFFIMVEESAKKSTEPFVFEPNDANTWVKVRGMLENYLTVLWRQGALAGAKPEHAFFVKCGLGQTMTAQDILEGKLIIEIGMAAVRPAEFIILRFSHKLQES